MIIQSPASCREGFSTPIGAGEISPRSVHREASPDIADRLMKSEWSPRVDISRSRKSEHHDAGIIRGASAYPMLGAIPQDFVVDSGSSDEPNLTEVFREKDIARRCAGDG